MAVFKCKMCGGGLNITEGMTVCECEYCGSVQTVPQLDDEKKINLFSRANRLRSAGEFDKASGVYETLVSDYPEEAEAYWGLLLCKFGIEYVDDPGTGKKVPTCHRSSFDSIMEDEVVVVALVGGDGRETGVEALLATHQDFPYFPVLVIDQELFDIHDIFLLADHADLINEVTVLKDIDCMFEDGFAGHLQKLLGLRATETGTAATGQNHCYILHILTNYYYYCLKN